MTSVSRESGIFEFVYYREDQKNEVGSAELSVAALQVIAPLTMLLLA